MKKMKKVMAVVMASAMALAMNVSTAFAAEAKYADAKLEVSTMDPTTREITVTVNGTGALASFDYGVVYDSTQVTYVSSTWASAWNDAWQAEGVDGISSKKNLTGYVVFGGTCSKDDFTWTEAIGTATFKVNDGVTSADFGVVSASAKFDNLTMASEGVAKTTVDLTATPAPTENATETPATQAPNDQTTAPVVTDAPKTSEAVKATTAPAKVEAAKTTTAPVAATAATTTTTNANAKTAKTGDTANVVIPMIALCAAAAAVVVASKKKVEE